MKTLTGLMLLFTLTTSALASENPRCFDEQDPTQDIIDGTRFDDRNHFTFNEYDSESYENLASVEVLSSKEPRFVITKKLVYSSPLGDGCKHAWEYILVDYTAKLPTGEICDATYVRSINAKTKITRSCVKQNLPFLPLFPFIPLVMFVEGLDRSCDSRKCNIESVIKLFGVKP